jgi:hypothetical protein
VQVNHETIDGNREILAWLRGEARRSKCARPSSLGVAPGEAAAQPQLELIDWDDLLRLLDEHLGADWHHGLGRHIEQSRRRHRDRR